jgi:photosystem II stability/assembly factor-like uncharacterized protein
MATTTPTRENETAKAPETKKPDAPRRKPNRRIKSFIGGVIIMALLGALGALALLGTTERQPGTPNTSATRTASLNGTPIAAPTVAAGVNLEWQAGARPVLYDVAVLPGQYQTLYAATANGLQRSADGGKTWADVTSFNGQNVTALATDADDGGALYVATDLGGLFKTGDDGKTWKNLGLVGRPINNVAASRRAVYVSVTGPRASIYGSLDAGQTWTAANSNSLPPDLRVQTIAIDAVNPQTVYIGTSYVESVRTTDLGRVKFSQDGGKSWRDLGTWNAENADSPNPRRAITLLVAALGDRIYAGDGENLWRLSPDRTLWQPVLGGLPTGGVYGLTTDPQLSGLVYAATRDGFYRNSDGQNWQKLATGEVSGFFTDESIQRSMSFAPAFVAATTSAAANSVNGLRSTYLYALSGDGRLTRYDNRDFGAELIATIPGADNIPDFSALGGTNPAEPQEAPAAGTNDPNRRYFPETRHYLSGEFKAVWESRDRNGLLLYGFPLTEQFQEFDPAQKITKTVQFFERVKFEQTRPGQPVLLGLIGYEAIQGRYFAPGRFITTNSSQQYFAETKHTLKGEFFRFWSANGGLQRFGFPLTEEFTEKSPDGKDIVYQYFQRTKFAFDASAPQNQRLTISLLGREVLQKRGWLQ